MLPVRVLLISALVGFAVASPLVWASWPEPAAAATAPAVGPDLPAPFLGPWVPAGGGSDAVGRALSNGYRWLPDGDLRTVAFQIAERWKQRALHPSYQNTEDGGLFLSAVDLDAGRQESFYLQRGAGGVSVWVTVAGLDTQAPTKTHGPAAGGSGETQERLIERPIERAEQLNKASLQEQGWMPQALSAEAKEQMLENGALVRYWTKNDRTLQELLQRDGRGTQMRLTQLPRQMDLDP